MPHRLVLLWLAAQPPLASQQAELDGWARAREVTLVAPAPAAAFAYDNAVAEQVESALEEARKAIGGRDAGASALLARADALLGAHPELPQAAWLQAEREHLALELLEQTGAPRGRLAEARTRAYALEGARAQTFDGARLEGEAPRAEQPPLVAGVRSADEVWVDGRSVRAEAMAPGLHHVLVQRASLVVWAGWANVESDLQLDVADPTRACSALDLAGTLAGDTRPEAPPGVLCAEWAAARVNASGSVDIAQCKGARCEGWSHYEQGGATPLAGARDTANDGKWLGQSWATWGLVAGAVAVATGVVLWQTGAFDTRERPPEFVFTGPAAAGLSF